MDLAGDETVDADVCGPLRSLDPQRAIEECFSPLVLDHDSDLRATSAVTSQYLAGDCNVVDSRLTIF